MRLMRAFLTITLVTTSAAARGREIYRNVTSKRERCFENSKTGRPAQRRLGFWTWGKKKQKADAYEKEGRRRDALPACGTQLDVPRRPPLLWCEAHRLRFPKRCGHTVLCVPQKNGNRDFSLLIYAMTYGAIPQQEMAMDTKLKHAGLSMTTVSVKDRSTSSVETPTRACCRCTWIRSCGALAWARTRAGSGGSIVIMTY